MYSIDMNNFKRLLVVFIFFFIHGTLCEETTMFDAITEKCTFLKNYSQPEPNYLQKQPHFFKCKDWNAISTMKSVRQLKEENFNLIRCLLYFETFVSFCKDLPSTNYTMIFAKSILGNNTDVKDVCNSFQLNPKIKGQNQFIWRVIQNKKLCEYLCSEVKEEVLGLNDMCAASYFYNNLIVNSITPVKLAVTSEKEETLKPKQQITNLDNNKVTANVTSTQIPNNVTSTNTSHLQIPNDFKHRLSGKNNSINEYIQPHPVEKTKIILETTTNFKSSYKITESAKTSTNLIDEHVRQPNQTLNKADISIITPNNERAETLPNLIDEHVRQPNQNLNKDDISIITPNNERAKTSTNLIDEHVRQPNQNLNKADISIISPNNEPKDNGISILEQEEEDVTLPEEVEKNSQQGESDTFETVKDDPFSETYNYDGDMEGNSYFFTYFTLICVSFIIGYVGYHNKQKILALLVEGRQSRRTQRDTRPNSANYHKLDSTLEEAISSSCNKNTSYVIY